MEAAGGEPGVPGVQQLSTIFAAFVVLSLFYRTGRLNRRPQRFQR
jgi:hypothetical protein